MNFASLQGAALFGWALRGQSGQKKQRARIAGAIAVGAGFVAWIRRWLAVYRTRKRLSELDDKGLADLGLYRDQIELVARRGRLPQWDEP